MSTYVDEAIGEEEIGFQVTDEIEVGDLSDQQGGVMDPASRVTFSVKKASVRTQQDKEHGVWAVKRLAIEAQIGPLGVDGEGKYANKVLFPEFILVFNAEIPGRFDSDWWRKEARYPTKQFLKALGYDISSIRVNDDFLMGLTGKEFIADIKRVPIRQQVNGKWENTGDFKNELANYRAVQPAE